MAVTTSSPTSPSRHRLAGDRVEALGDEVVLGDVHAGAALALAGHARPGELGEPVVVGGHHRQPGLDLRAHLLAAGLGAEHAQPQLEARGLDAVLLQHLADVQRVGRRGDEDRGAEVLHDLDLARRVAGADGHDRDAGLLQPVVQAEPPGEHAVAEGDLGDVAAVRADGDGEAADQLGPGLEVGARVAADDGLAGGAGRRVDLDHLVQRHGEQAVGIRVAEVVLLGERQAAQVVEAREVAGREPGAVERGAVERDACRTRGRASVRSRSSCSASTRSRSMVSCCGSQMAIVLSLGRCRAAGNHTGPVRSRFDDTPRGTIGLRLGNRQRGAVG